MPEFVQTLKGTYSTSNKLEDRVVYHNYYANGNIKEVSKKDGVYIVYLWGYNQTQPIAKIENATSSEVSRALLNLNANYNTIKKIQNLSNLDNDRTIDFVNTNGTITKIGKEGNLREALRNLRNALPNAQVSTYTYDPLIGVTSITDPRGQTIYYYYDNFNRLQYVKDQEGNILSKNEYNYKN
ncbi:MAG: hypothetical protein ACWIPI_09100 [Polaribacter sp.]